MNISVINRSAFNRRAFALLFSIIFISGCFQEEVIEAYECDLDALPVVICTISPDDSIQLLLYYSSVINAPYMSIKEKGIYDATVEIRNEDGEKIALEICDTNIPLYVASQTEFKVYPGEKYFLRISIDTDHILTSSTVVPDQKIEFDEFKFYNKKDIYDNIRDRYKTTVDVFGSWNLNNNYVKLIVQRNIHTYQQNELVQNPIITNYLDNFVDIDVNTSNYYFIDRDVVLIIKDEIYYTVFNWKYAIVTPNSDLTSYLKSYDHLHKNKEAMDIKSFLDLYHGIIPEYSNIEGGLGIFGAFLMDVKDVSL